MRSIRNKYLLVGLLFFQLFYSCKKVINVDLKNAATQTVITGEITNQAGPYQVIISKSVNYTSDNIYQPVSGALVIIAGNGVIDTLTETMAGTYSTHTLTGKPGSSYSLYVAIGTQKYTATSVMPQPVTLDSIGFTTGRNTTDLNAIAYFQDPINVVNNYQFIEFNNGKRFSNGRGTTVFSDRLSDGRYINRTLYDDSTNIKSGDLLTLQMKCVDQPVYDYLNELLQVSGGGRGGFSSSNPGNPTSNIIGGALGYFTANTISTKNSIVH